MPVTGTAPTVPAASAASKGETMPVIGTMPTVPSASGFVAAPLTAAASGAHTATVSAGGAMRPPPSGVYQTVLAVESPGPGPLPARRRHGWLVLGLVACGMIVWLVVAVLVRDCNGTSETPAATRSAPSNAAPPSAAVGAAPEPHPAPGADAPEEDARTDDRDDEPDRARKKPPRSEPAKRSKPRPRGPKHDPDARRHEKRKSDPHREGKSDHRIPPGHRKKGRR